MQHELVRQVADDLWTVEGPDLVFAGLPVNTRMTVARLIDGRLWVHSPVALNDGTAKFVEGLGGEVAALVAPNKFHHLFIQPWRERYPGASVYAHSDLQTKIPTLADAETLTNEAPAGYADTIDQVLFAGNPLFGEAVFFHRPSAAVIFTDLAQNIDTTNAAWFARLYARFEGVASPGGVPRLYKWLTTDRQSLRAALATVNDWSPEILLFCHGEPLEVNAQAWINEQFAYLS